MVRSKHAMQPLGHALPGALAELLRSAPLSPGKVDFAWKAVVGPAVERVTAVRLEAGTLRVDAAGPQWAREIRRSAHMIVPRLQALLGSDVVQAMTVRARD
jgi:Dna[CI] antecedent, DciA